MYSLLSDSQTINKRKKLIKPIASIALGIAFLILFTYFYFFIEPNSECFASNDLYYPPNTNSTLMNDELQV